MEVAWFWKAPIERGVPKYLEQEVVTTCILEGEYYIPELVEQHTKCCLSVLDGHMRKDTRLCPCMHIHIPDQGSLGTRLGSYWIEASCISHLSLVAAEQYDILCI